MAAMLDWQSLTTAIMFIGTVLAGSSAILMWIYRELNNIRDAQAHLHVKIVEEFVNYETLHQLEERMEKSVQRIEGRLDRIMDYIKVQSGPERTDSV